MFEIATESYAEAAARWAAQLAAHTEAHPEHSTSRDATHGGHTYCYGCHRYITS